MEGKRKFLRNVLAMISSVCLAVFCAISAYAADGYSLTLEYGRDGTTFYIYCVGDYNGSGYELAEGYMESGTTIPSEDGWTATAATLADYVEENGIEAELNGMTVDGSVAFTGLSNGLYLIVGESVSQDGYTYSPVSFLVLISDEDVTSSVKSEITEESSSGTEYDMEESGTGEENAADGSGTDTTETSGSDTSDASSSKLPQTGQLWLPVFILAVAGVVLIITGCFKTKKRNKGTEI